ncbi:MAG: dihydroorotase [Planctomycetota bacterium]
MSGPGTILIQGGHVLCPATGLNEPADVLVMYGRIADVAPNIERQTDRVIDARGHLVTPGLIDIHVHLREPGFERKETIESGARAAVAGGFTTVCAMPNTRPPLDTRSSLEFVTFQARRTGLARVLPIGCVTKGRKGEELSEMADLVAGGACAFSDDGDPIANADLMRRAIAYADMLDRVITDHCEDRQLSGGGQMHEGDVSLRLGVPGIPGSADDVIVARNILLAEALDARVHIAHISTARSVDLVREGQSRGVKVTAEVSAHHLVLTDEACRDFDPSKHKMHPPLRSEQDRQAMIQGLCDGTIGAIASDHAPHTRDEKEREWALAPNGITGLESTLPIVMTDLVEPGILSLETMIERLTIGPVRCLRLDAPGQFPSSSGTIEPGVPADVCVIDRETTYRLGAGGYQSLAINSPFTNREVRGLARYVMVGGRVVSEARVEGGVARFTIAGPEEGPLG